MIVATGGVILAALLWGLRWFGAPTWVVIAPWVVPTAAVLIWSLLRPQPAVATDDDDDGWTTYSLLFVLVGEESVRPAPVRMIAAAIFGAPVIWSLLVFGLSTLVGVF